MSFKPDPVSSPPHLPALLPLGCRARLLSALLAGLVGLAGPLISGCALDEDPAELAESTSAILSGEQVYEISNIYNTGGANGFALSHAAIHDFGNMYASQNYQVQFWPGGPVAGGALGAAITYDGQPLPSYWTTGVVALPGDASAYSNAVDNMNDLTAILISRTPYAAYFSLGSLVASAASQAQRSGAALPEGQRAWNLSLSLLGDAITLANALCRPSTNVWKTAFNVQEMRDLLSSAPSGPNQGNWAPWGYPRSNRDYLHARLTTILNNLGRVISTPSTLETGVHGQGCIN